MDFHIPLIFIYASIFLLSFLLLGLAMAKFQANERGKALIFTFIAGVVSYAVASVYATEFLKFLTLNLGWFVFGGAALALLVSLFFKWQKWVLWLYSLIVVFTSVATYLKWI